MVIYWWKWRHSVRAWRPFSPINISQKGGSLSERAFWKWGSLGESKIWKIKRGSFSDRLLENGGQCSRTYPSHIFRKYLPPPPPPDSAVHRVRQQSALISAFSLSLSPFRWANWLGMLSAKEDIWSVPQCTMLLCYSGSTSHNAQCFYDDHDQFSQFSPHCRIDVHSSIILKDTVWIAEFSWFSSLFGIFKALLSLDNLNR